MFSKRRPKIISGIPLIKINIWIKLAIILFWIAEIFGSLDFQIEASLGFQSIFLPIQNFFSNKFFIPIFTGFEFLIFVMLILLVLAYRKKLTSLPPILKRLFIITCVVVVFVLINPNNNFSKFFYVLLKEVKGWFLFLIFMYIIWSLEFQIYSSLMYYFLKSGIKVVVLKAVIAITAYFMGNGMSLWSVPSTIVQGDTLLWIATFQIILFGIFLLNRKNIFIILSLILFVCLALSFRRTSLFLCIFSDVLLFVFWGYITKNKIKIFSTLIPILLGIILFVTVFGSNSKVQTYLARYFAAIEFTGLVKVSDQYNTDEFTDSGHLEQSLTTTNSLFNNLGMFWGSGLRSKVRIVEGQSSGAIHNNIAFVWAAYGMYMVIYFLIVFFICFRFIFKTLRSRSKISSLRYICFVMMLYQVMELIAGWSSGYTFIQVLQYSTKFVLVMSTIKLYYINLTPENITGIHKNPVYVKS